MVYVLVKKKRKDKAVTVHAIKTYGRGVEVQLHSFLNSELDDGGRLASRPNPFPSGKGRRFPLHRRLGGPQSLSGSFGREITNVQCVCTGLTQCTVCVLV